MRSECSLYQILLQKGPGFDDPYGFHSAPEVSVIISNNDQQKGWRNTDPDLDSPIFIMTTWPSSRLGLTGCNEILAKSSPHGENCFFNLMFLFQLVLQRHANLAA